MQQLFRPVLAILLLVGLGFTNLYAQNDKKETSYLFSIVKADSACWKTVPDTVPQIIVRLSGSCGCTLLIGDVQLKIDGTGQIFRYEKENGNLKLPSGAILRPPDSPNNGTIQVAWDTTCTEAYKKKPLLEVKKCPSGESTQTAANTPTLPVSPYYFIPSAEQERIFLAKAGTGDLDNDCCPGSQELLFNYATQCLVPVCDLEGCCCGSCFTFKKKADACDSCKQIFKCRYRHNALERFHPRVDGKLRVRIVGLHPLQDSVALRVSYEDRNKEGRAEFIAMMNKAKKDQTTQESGEKTDDKTANASSHVPGKKQESGVALIPIFRNEMIQFYNEKLAIQQLEPDFLALCVTFIQGNIRKHFIIPAATQALMSEKVDEWLDADTINLSAAEKSKLRAAFKEGLQYYQRIINYRASSALLFQVKDHDITKLSFYGYRNGTALSDEPRTFEFFNKGGFTIDFSAGIVINQLVNHAFNTIVVDSAGVTKYRILQQDSGKINLGPAVFAHAYYRYPIWNRFKLGATTGFMTNTLDDNFGLNFLFGGSALFGSAQRFALTTGWIIGKVDRLAEGLAVGQLLDPPNSPGETTSVDTKRVYRCKWFVGISYNLGN
ncbi:MAG: hypothetical protein KDD14_04880 [Saprospiraceae bacterium]|nr:hypothetical protein [Saprospiraceae bacterium]